MSSSIRRFGPLGFVIMAICAPTVLSFGNDGQGHPMPPVPGKSRLMAAAATCQTVAAQVSFPSGTTWTAGQPFTAVVDFGAGGVNPMTVADAVLCYSYYQPVCSPDIGNNAGFSASGDGNSSEWFPASITPQTAPGTAVTIVFTPRAPLLASPDGTGKGIIIVTLRVGNNLPRYVAGSLTPFNLAQQQ